jgi:molybdopterin synthase sulfur carrier subunit
MTVRVLFFASLRERVKRSDASWSVADGATVETLWQTLVAELPAIEAMSGAVRFAVNREYVDRGHVLTEGDEVAIIPPVSGGI